MAQINKPSEYFNTKLYSGSGSTTTLTGVGFQPDWTWIKRRNSSINHKIYDAVRTAGKSISSNNTAAEITNDAEGYLSAFTSDGFTVQAGTTSDEYVNQSGGTYASWNWLAGGTGVTNTDGSITSTVSANTTSGFSIVTYSGNSTAGATIGHGLNSVPSMVIVKSITNAESWPVYLKSVTTANNYYLYLNSTGALVTSGGDRWSVGSNSSTLFGLGNDGTTNQSGQTYVAYCFAEKKGFSKFGSYVGNGSTDGTFIYTGFKPAYVMIKRTDAVSEWTMWDNKRNTYNVTNLELEANTSDAEANVGGREIDLLSNGIKIRGDSIYTNASGGTYIYMAFASEPLVGTNNIPATAR